MLPTVYCELLAFIILNQTKKMLEKSYRILHNGLSLFHVVLHLRVAMAYELDEHLLHDFRLHSELVEALSNGRAALMN